jgi:ribosomal small subunit protein bTHX
MGKGDKKSKRGKINLGTHGKTRPNKIKKPITKQPVENKTDIQ